MAVLSVLIASASLAAASSGAAGEAPTFNRDVAPILRRACVSCHQVGQAAPFPLVTYQDAKPRARLIARVIADRIMPPWQPDPGYGAFAGERRLTAADIDTIARWASAGSPEGTAADRPPVTPPEGVAGLARSDAVLRMPEPYSLATSGRDQIRTFVVPTQFPDRRYVRGLAFSPGDTRAIHHANIKIDPTRSTRWLDEQDPDVGYEGAGGRNAVFPDGHFLGWTVGQSPRLTDDAPWTLEPGADIVLEVHLTPTGRTEKIQPVLTLAFADQPAALPPYMIRIGRQDLDIPPGASAHRVIDHYTLPTDVTVLAVQPHAHSLASKLQGYATRPDGSVTPLIRISRWDPRWQDVYRYAAPVALPRGTTVTVEYVFDNSNRNPRNPNNPPQRVLFGQAASSEMGDLWLQVRTENADDRRALDRDFSPKMLQEDIAGARKVLAANPSDPRAHTDLALCLTAAGRANDALVHLEAAARLAPTSVGARFELGLALLRARRFEQARAQLLEAVRLKPDFAEAHSNVGAAWHASGNPREAISWYERALALNPRDHEAEYNLGYAHVALGELTLGIRHYEAALALAPADPLTLTGLASALARSRQEAAAVTHYRRALAVRPDFVPALADLAWMLATSDAVERNPKEAVALARRANELTAGKNAIVLDTLAVAYAALGQPDDAVKSAREALDVADAAGDEEFSRRIRQRLEFFEHQWRQARQ